MQTFLKTYAKELEKAVQKYPKEYGCSIEQIPGVLGRMAIAFQKGTYNKDGRAIRNTCKALGIKHSYTAINHFIANHE
jgi:hypothetical protein